MTIIQNEQSKKLDRLIYQRDMCKRVIKRHKDAIDVKKDHLSGIEAKIRELHNQY